MLGEHGIVGTGTEDEEEEEQEEDEDEEEDAAVLFATGGNEIGDRLERGEMGVGRVGGDVPAAVPVEVGVDALRLVPVSVRLFLRLMKALCS